jgi:hypothetical protein
MIPLGFHLGDTFMKRTILALGAAAFLAASLPAPAQAHCNGCGVAAGVVGGLAAGAIIGSALAGPRYYAPPPPPPAYYYGEDGPVCHVEHRRIWVEGYGWRHRRVEVCD